MNNYHNNAVKKISLYKQRNVWVFDDEHLGLTAEAFVLGATEAIDSMLSSIDTITNKSTPTVIFGEDLPEFDAKITKTEDLGSNAWYDYLGHRLWLCSVLSMFFKTPPNNIFIKFQN